MTEWQSLGGLRTAVRRLRAQGLRVHPLLPGQKRPRIALQARKDYPKTCEAKDFREGEGIGLICGPCGAGRGEHTYLVCLDLDGEVAWDDVEQALGVSIPETLSTHTCAHLWFWVTPPYADRLKNNARLVEFEAGALDIRTFGGQVWLRTPDALEFDVSEIEVMPVELAAALVARSGGASASSTEPAKAVGDGQGLTSEHLRRLSAAAIQAWPPRGTRHDYCRALGGSLFRLGATREQTAALARAMVYVVDTGDFGARLRDVLAGWDDTREGHVRVWGIPKLKDASADPEALSGAIDIVLGEGDEDDTDDNPSDGLARVQSLLAGKDDAEADGPLAAYATDDLLDAAIDNAPEDMREFIDAQIDRGHEARAVALMSLCALSAAGLGAVRVQLESGYTEPAIIWGCVVAPPGASKTSVQNVAFAPIYQREREHQTGDLLEEHYLEVAQWKIADKERRDLERNPDDAADLARVLALPATPPVNWRLTLERATDAALTQFLVAHGRAAIVTSEGSAVFGGAVAQREHSAERISIMVKGYDGEPVRVELKSEASQLIERADLSVACMTQPGVAQSVLSDARSVDQGFAQRFCWVRSPPPPDRFPTEPMPPAPPETTKRWADMLTTLLDVEDYPVHFTPAALKAYWKYNARIAELYDSTPSLVVRGWLAKHRNRIARIAGLFAAAKGYSEVGTETWAEAVAWGEWLAAELRWAVLGPLSELEGEVLVAIRESEKGSLNLTELRIKVPKLARTEGKALVDLLTAMPFIDTKAVTKGHRWSIKADYL